MSEQWTCGREAEGHSDFSLSVINDLRIEIITLKERVEKAEGIVHDAKVALSIQKDERNANWAEIVKQRERAERYKAQLEEFIGEGFIEWEDEFAEGYNGTKVNERENEDDNKS